MQPSNLPPMPEHLAGRALATLAYSYGINAQNAFEMWRRGEAAGMDFLRQEEANLLRLLSVRGTPVTIDETIYIAEIHIGVLALLKLADADA